MGWGLRTGQERVPGAAPTLTLPSGHYSRRASSGWLAVLVLAPRGLSARMALPSGSGGARSAAHRAWSLIRHHIPDSASATKSRWQASDNDASVGIQIHLIERQIALLYHVQLTTVTDPVGKWKSYTYDEFGNLTVVMEPNPAGGTWTTNYTYSPLNQPHPGVDDPPLGNSNAYLYLHGGGHDQRDQSRKRHGHLYV
jgi:hypothetical protein